MSSNKELHPYLEYFDPNRQLKYLIVGSFPPNSETREKFFIKYFYGNSKESIWNILKKTQLFEHPFLDIQSIRKWETDYCVGVVDILKSCGRKDKRSSKDIDLIYDKQDLNYELKSYVENNISTIERIFFTSNFVRKLFESLMDQAFSDVLETRTITLPSPSGEYLRSLFNKNDKTFGLKPAFLSFLEKNNYGEAIEQARRTFGQKQYERAKAVHEGKDPKKIKVERFPNANINYPALFRIEEYKRAFAILKPCVEK